MKVEIKDLGIPLNVGSKGIEFEIRTPDGKSQVGDVYLTMTGITWCKGKTKKANGKKISWAKFIAHMNAL
jgi:hypothetical protein